MVILKYMEYWNWKEIKVVDCEVISEPFSSVK